VTTTELLVANHRRFLSFLERRVPSREIAEDLLQAAFAKATERASDLRDDESAVAWFYRLLRNSLIDYYRHKDAEQRALDRLPADEPAEDPELRDVVCTCVAELATTLKPEYAAALRRVEVEGASLQQLAAENGISANNAAVRLHRARQALREQVELTCRTCAEHGCIDCTCE
jgi:RNA polymerase sigma-70 factor (ECF subfamily)